MRSLESRAYPADGLGPACTSCGQRITESSQTICIATTDRRGTARVEPLSGPWVNQPCGCSVTEQPR